MPAVRRARDGVADPAGADPAVAPGRAGGPWRRLRAMPPTGLVILAATVLALALRLFLVTRPGFLTSGTVEYDDGVYLGTATRLLHGAMPYKDYAFVQPPGVVVVALPAGLAGALTSQATGLAVARVLSVLASTACVPLVGRLVRHRGVITCAVAAGLLAVYPADVLSARTLLLEPWMNLACLLAATAAFREGRLASPKWIALAGVAFGCGVAIKFWAAFPAAVLLAACLAARPPAGTSRGRRAGALAGGAAGGFAVLAGPFALAAPSAFIHQTLLYQASRVGSQSPPSLRLAHLTGLIDVLTRDGKLAAPGSTAHSLFAMGAEASTRTVAVGWPAYAAAAAGLAVLAAGYLTRVRQRTPLEWFALATAALATAAIMGYSAFFYHYPDFPAPWLAIAAGTAVGSLACLLQGGAPRAIAARRAVGATVAGVRVAGWRPRTARPARLAPPPSFPRAPAWSPTRSPSPSRRTGSPRLALAARTSSTRSRPPSRSAAACHRRAAPGRRRGWWRAGRPSSARRATCGCRAASPPASRGRRPSSPGSPAISGCSPRTRPTGAASSTSAITEPRLRPPGNGG